MKGSSRKTASVSKRKLPLQKTGGSANVANRLIVLDCFVRHAVVATASDDGPYTSLVSFALLPDASGIIFATPRKTRKYRNILKDSRVSVLIDSRVNDETDYEFSEAVTMQGTAKAIRRGKRRDALAALFLKKHQALKDFLDATDTALMLVEAEVCYHAGRFQEVTEWRPGP